MNDRLKLVLLLVVAFGGGLLAMVGVARLLQQEPAPSPVEVVDLTGTAAVTNSPQPPSTNASPGAGASPDGPTRTVDAQTREALRGAETVAVPGESAGSEAGAASTAAAARAGDDEPAPSSSARRRSVASSGSGGGGGALPPPVDMLIPGPAEPSAPASRDPGRKPGFDSAASGGNGGGQPIFIDPAAGVDRSATPARNPGPPAAEADSQPDSGAEPQEPIEQIEQNTENPFGDDTSPDDGPDLDPDPEPEPQLPARVQMIPSDVAPAVGSTFAVTIEISAAENVAHVPFHLSYDPSALTYNEASEGGYLGLDGVQTAFYATRSTSGDSVVVGLSRMGRHPGIDGAGELCVFFFTAETPGATTLRFTRAKVKDPDNQILPASFAPLTVMVR